MRFVPLHTAFNSKVKLRLLRFLFDNYSPMGEREFARVAGISYMSVHRLMHEFSELDLVYSKRMGNVVVWHVNDGSLAYKELKKSMESIERLEDPFKHLTKTIQGELSKYPVVKVMLFGSVAQHEERSSSDVDLFVLVKSKQTKRLVVTALTELNRKCLQLYGNPLMPYVLTQQEFDHPSNPYLIENIKKGTQIMSANATPGRNG